MEIIEKFKSKAQEFLQALNKLNSIQDIPPNLNGEYSRLQNEAQNIQSTIGWVTSTADSVHSYVTDFFGYNTADTLDNYTTGNSGRLGVLPLAPIAAISAGIAVMSKFISDVYVFERKVTEQKRLESSGMPPEKAAEIVDNIDNGSTIKSITALAKPLLFIGGSIFLIKLLRNN